MLTTEQCRKKNVKGKCTFTKLQSYLIVRQHIIVKAQRSGPHKASQEGNIWRGRGENTKKHKWPYTLLVCDKK